MLSILFVWLIFMVSTSGLGVLLCMSKLSTDYSVPVPPSLGLQSVISESEIVGLGWGICPDTKPLAFPLKGI